MQSRSTPHAVHRLGPHAASIRCVVAAGGPSHFGPGLTSTYFVDPETGERRPSRCGDPAMAARVADALPNIDYVMGLGLIQDIPRSDLAPVYEFAELTRRTPASRSSAGHMTRRTLPQCTGWRVAAAGSEEVLRDRPIFALFSTYPSPLRHTDEDLGNVIWAARHGIPVVYLGGPTVGIESPFSGASALVLHQAAALSGLAVIQLAQPGAAAAIGGLPSPMDLRTARPSYGSPEASLHSAAAADLARFLGLPFMGTAGASESKLHRRTGRAGGSAADPHVPAERRVAWCTTPGSSIAPISARCRCSCLPTRSSAWPAGSRGGRGQPGCDHARPDREGRPGRALPGRAGVGRRCPAAKCGCRPCSTATSTPSGSRRARGTPSQRVHDKLRKILAKHRPPAAAGRRCSLPSRQSWPARPAGNHVQT